MSCLNIHKNNQVVDNDVDKENRTPVNNVKSVQSTVGHALTQPRMANISRRSNNDEEKQHTPCVMTLNEAKSKSAPGPKVLKNITNVIGGSGPSLEGEIESILEDIVDDDSPLLHKRKSENVVDKKAKGLKVTQKKEKALSVPVCAQDYQMIVKTLDLDIDKQELEQFETPLMLFRYLEEKGQLSAKVLSYFARFSSIDTLNLSPSYSSCLNEFGLVEPGRFPNSKCTVPLFNGFENLIVLDLTNVMIGDDELRYVIKLKSLKAIGLAGTKITNKGLKYLGKHAEFRKILQCVKLCYNSSIDDSGLGYLASFKALSEVDLLGCDKITMAGCISLVKNNVMLSRVRLPVTITERVEELHHVYSGMTRKYHDLILTSIDCLTLDEEALKKQLRYHRNQFPNIFLNAPKDALMKRLCEILTERSYQERLFCCLNM